MKKMKSPITLHHEFVETFPDKLEHGTLYVSMEFATVAHACVCGCGNQVITPLSPADWQLIFDGESISLRPSIGNWSFDCQSHYWIDMNKVRWAPRWTQEEIALGREYDRRAQGQHYDCTPLPEAAQTASEASEAASKGFFQRVRKWLSSIFQH